MGIVATQTGLLGSGINRITGDTAIRSGEMGVPNHRHALNGPSFQIRDAMIRRFAGIQQIAVSGTGRIKGSGKKNLMAGGTEIELPGIFAHRLAVFRASGCRSAEDAAMVMAGSALNKGECRQPLNVAKKGGQLFAVHPGGFCAILAKNIIAMAAGAKGVVDCAQRGGMSALLVCGQNIGGNPGAVLRDAGRQGAMALAADVEIRHWIRMIRDYRQVERAGAMAIFAPDRRHPPGRKREIAKPGGQGPAIANGIVAAQAGGVGSGINRTGPSMPGGKVTSHRVGSKGFMTSQTTVAADVGDVLIIGTENRDGDVARSRVGAAATAGSQRNKQQEGR